MDEDQQRSTAGGLDHVPHRSKRREESQFSVLTESGALAGQRVAWLGVVPAVTSLDWTDGVPPWDASRAVRFED